MSAKLSARQATLEKINGMLDKLFGSWRQCAALLLILTLSSLSVPLRPRPKLPSLPPHVQLTSPGTLRVDWLVGPSPCATGLPVCHKRTKGCHPDR